LLDYFDYSYCARPLCAGAPVTLVIEIIQSNG
jgi:hypothetical protein